MKRARLIASATACWLTAAQPLLRQVPQVKSEDTGPNLLDRIELGLRKTGDLTDDLSLVRIAYKEDFPYEETPTVDPIEDARRLARTAGSLPRHGRFFYLRAVAYRPGLGLEPRVVGGVRADPRPEAAN